jgi:uncharacterized protein (DUF1697 family)
MSTQYLALLRGINVGGNNIIKMADLKACFKEMGFTNVKTYIQSGNVIFSQPDENSTMPASIPHQTTKKSDKKEELTARIEEVLPDKFDYTSRIVLVSTEHLDAVISKAPKDFGEKPELYKYDVLFLKPPFSSEEALATITTRDDVDRVWGGPQVLYFSRLIKKAGSSYLNKLVGTATYKKMTIRNWNTTSKLHTLMHG